MQLTSRTKVDNTCDPLCLKHDFKNVLRAELKWDSPPCFHYCFHPFVLKYLQHGYIISSLCLSEKLFLQVSHIFQCLQACCCYIYWKSAIPCRVGTLPIAGGTLARLTGLGLMDTHREVYVSKYLLFFQKI